MDDADACPGGQHDSRHGLGGLPASQVAEADVRRGALVGPVGLTSPATVGYPDNVQVDELPLL